MYSQEHKSTLGSFGRNVNFYRRYPPGSSLWDGYGWIEAIEKPIEMQYTTGSGGEKIPRFKKGLTERMLLERLEIPDVYSATHSRALTISAKEGTLDKIEEVLINNYGCSREKPRRKNISGFREIYER